MTALDLSMPKALYLSVKNNNDNNLISSVHHYSHDYNHQNNIESDRKEYKEQRSIGSQSPHSTVTSDKIEDVKEEPIEMTNIDQKHNLPLPQKS